MSGTNQKLASIETVVHEIRNLVKGLKCDKQPAGENKKAAIEHALAQTHHPVVAQIEPTPTPSDVSSKCQHQPAPKWKTRLELTALIFGIGYAIVTGLLWWDQHRNFKRDERAWIAIKEMQITQLSAGKVLMGEVRIVDTGRTPGVNATFPGGIQTSHSFEDALTQYAKLKQPFFYPSVLFPGIDQVLPSSTKETLDDGQVKAIEAGLLQVYLIGDIHYSDVFGCPHTTHYCGKYRFETKRFENCGMKAN